MIQSTDKLPADRLGHHDPASTLRVYRPDEQTSRLPAIDALTLAANALGQAVRFGHCNGDYLAGYAEGGIDISWWPSGDCRYMTEIRVAFHGIVR